MPTEEEKPHGSHLTITYI